MMKLVKLITAVAVGVAAVGTCVLQLPYLGKEIKDSYNDFMGYI